MEGEKSVEERISLDGTKEKLDEEPKVEEIAAFDDAYGKMEE